MTDAELIAELADKLIAGDVDGAVALLLSAVMP